MLHDKILFLCLEVIVGLSILWLLFKVVRRHSSKVHSDPLEQIYPRFQKRLQILRHVQKILLIGLVLSFTLLAACVLQQSLATRAASKGQAHLYVLLDTSLSMNVTDAGGWQTRLEQSKQKISELLATSPDATVTLVTFHSQPLIYEPTTASNADTQIKSVMPIPYFATKGSSFGNLFHAVLQDIEATKQIAPKDSFYLLIASDGEETSPGNYDLHDAITKLKPFLKQSLVLGVGSDAGAVVRYDPYPPASVLDQSELKEVAGSLSSKDKTNLQNLAKGLGGSYQDLGPQSTQKQLLQLLDIPVRSRAPASAPTQYWYWPLTIIIFTLLSIYVWLPTFYVSSSFKTIHRKARPHEK